jgi:hypothetical protein
VFGMGTGVASSLSPPETAVGLCQLNRGLSGRSWIEPVTPVKWSSLTAN